MLFLQRLCLAQLPLPHQIPFSPLALPPMPSSWNALSPAVSMVGSSSFRFQLTCHLLRVPPITASLELLPRPLPLITLPWFAAFIALDDFKLAFFHLLKALPSRAKNSSVCFVAVSPVLRAVLAHSGCLIYAHLLSEWSWCGGPGSSVDLVPASWMSLGNSHPLLYLSLFAGVTRGLGIHGL